LRNAPASSLRTWTQSIPSVRQLSHNHLRVTASTSHHRQRPSCSGA